MGLRSLQEQSSIFSSRAISYYLKHAISDLGIDIDIIAYQDISGSYYVKTLGVETAIEILQSRKSKFILYVACDHVADNMHIVENSLRDSLPDAKILSITGDGSCYKLVDDKLYYPYYWYAFLPGPQKHYTAWQLDSSRFRDPRIHPASCLNNLCRYHRIKLLDKFFYKSYFRRILYSFNSNVADDYYDVSEMQRLVLKYKNFLPLRLDRNNAEYGNDMLTLDHPGLHDSYLNIVTANHYDVCFIDEKIFKPLAAGQIFVTLAGPGTIDLVRKLGFDVFDDIVNHNYDTEKDLDIRISKLVSTVDDWMKLDHEKIWKATYARRVKNAEHFFSLDVSKNPFKEFLKQFN